MLAKFAKYRILIIQDTVVLWFLVFDDKFLDADIFLHCMVTVQMVLCDVEDRTDLWCKFFDRLQLETADLRYCCGILFHFQCFGSVWSSNVSHYKDRVLCITHDLAKKGCCGCFAICSGDCEYPSLAGTVSQFYFSPYRKSHLIKFLHDRNICRYSRAQYNQIKTFQNFLRKLTGINRGILCVRYFRQNRILVCFFVSVKKDHMSSCLFQKICSSDAAFACSKDKYSFSL